MTNSDTTKFLGQPESMPSNRIRRRRSRTPRKYVPYADAKSGMRAREEAHKILRRVGAEQIGFVDDHQAQELVLVFSQRGKAYKFPVSVRGLAAMFLEQKPYSSRMRVAFNDYKQKMLDQALISASSVARDWVKGNAVAVECGARSFEHMFAGALLTNDGRSLAERVTEMKGLLPPPQESKAIALNAPASNGSVS